MPGKHYFLDNSTFQVASSFGLCCWKKSETVSVFLYLWSVHLWSLWDIRCWSMKMVKKKFNAQRHSGFRVPNSKTSYFTILLTTLQYRILCLPICWAQFFFKIITASTKLHLQYIVKSSSHTDHAVLGLKSGSPWPGTIVNCIREVQSQLEESCKLYVRRLPFWALDPRISKLGILAIQKMQNPVP